MEMVWLFVTFRKLYKNTQAYAHTALLPTPTHFLLLYAYYRGQGVYVEAEIPVVPSGNVCQENPARNRTERINARMTDEMILPPTRILKEIRNKLY